MEKLGVGKIATLCGRYFAMDRDHRWERTEKAYDLITQGTGEKITSIKEAIKKSYEKEITDEFIEPMVIDKDGLIKDHDGVIFFNFRIDRPRQLTEALVLPDFEKVKVTKISFDPYAEKYGWHQYQKPKITTTFKRKKILKDLFFVTMTEYEKNHLQVQIAFPPEVVKLPLGRILSENNLRQFHIAETEKERFVTYYFNGQREDPFPEEDRVKIPSSKVATYDKKPEMSAYEITEELNRRLKARFYDFAIVNFANPDMVGHTGVLNAGIKACEVVDECLGKIVETVNNLGGVTIITADHGNVEEMIDPVTGEIDTEHSTNPVPFIVVGNQFRQVNLLPQGILADVAPTILAMMKIDKPDLMIGRNLFNF